MQTRFVRCRSIQYESWSNDVDDDCDGSMCNMFILNFNRTMQISLDILGRQMMMPIMIMIIIIIRVDIFHWPCSIDDELARNFSLISFNNGHRLTCRTTIVRSIFICLHNTMKFRCQSNKRLLLNVLDIERSTGVVR
jgi:hypothetical protein